MKSKLLISFIAFSVVVITLLWLLEVVFLDQIYRSIKISSVRNAAEELHGLSDEQLLRFSQETSSSVGLCVSIYDDSLNVIGEGHNGGRCVVHNVSSRTIKTFFEATKEFEGARFESHLSAEEITSILKRNQHVLDFYQFPPGFFFERDHTSESTSGTYDCVLYSQIFENDVGEERYALISAVLLPIEPTVQTIRFILNLLIGILIIISVLMSVILSKTISGPIVKLNKASKSLPEGDFDGQNIKGYREVEELAETLRLSSLEIQQVDRLRKELIANVSHDLRTPLTLISGYSEVMRDIPGENTPENLQVVIDESRRLSELVTDLMDLSKLEAGMEQMNYEKVEIISFVRKILSRYEKMTELQGFSLSLETDLEEAYVSADVVKLNQIVYNLVNNAIHYCGEDQCVIVKISLVDNRVFIEVIDHGEGIPEDQIALIWDRYYRVDRNHRASAVGTGLGLSIVKKLLILHNAEYGVSSALGKGSSFWFSLEIYRSES
ncbi:MAG: HAMP domain-containing histidine kinase [Ruminococcaceae bacterium]|nr:HAMP domain-containing histidine kinase [Oscillospiraceae bacterium]